MCLCVCCSLSDVVCSPFSLFHLLSTGPSTQMQVLVVDCSSCVIGVLQHIHTCVTILFSFLVFVLLHLARSSTPRSSLLTFPQTVSSTTRTSASSPHRHTRLQISGEPPIVEALPCLCSSRLSARRLAVGHTATPAGPHPPCLSPNNLMLAASSHCSPSWPGRLLYVYVLLLVYLFAAVSVSVCCCELLCKRLVVCLWLGATCDIGHFESCVSPCMAV